MIINLNVELNIIYIYIWYHKRVRVKIKVWGMHLSLGETILGAILRQRFGEGRTSLLTIGWVLCSRIWGFSYPLIDVMLLLFLSLWNVSKQSIFISMNNMFYIKIWILRVDRCYDLCPNGIITFGHFLLSIWFLDG